MGSVARVMRNFGLSSLRVSSPHPQVGLPVGEVGEDGCRPYEFNQQVTGRESARSSLFLGVPVSSFHP